MRAVSGQVNFSLLNIIVIFSFLLIFIINLASPTISYLRYWYYFSSNLYLYYGFTRRKFFSVINLQSCGLILGQSQNLLLQDLFCGHYLLYMCILWTNWSSASFFYVLTFLLVKVSCPRILHSYLSIPIPHYPSFIHHPSAKFSLWNFIK